MKIIPILILFFTFVVSADSYEITPERILEVESQISLPPDPGQNGEAQKIGYDVDGDGVRDDIQRYLEFRYFDDPKMKAVFYDYALSELNEIALSEESIIFIQELSKKREPSFWCLTWLSRVNKQRDYESERLEIRKRILNTVDRYKAVMIFNSKLAGMSFTAMEPESYKSYCKKYGLLE